MNRVKDIAIILLIAAFIVSLCIHTPSRTGECSTYRDTITDTIPYYLPVPKDSLVIRYVTERLPNAENDDKEDNFPITDTIIADSSDVVIPITQKIYTDDSTYIAYVSGYQAALDSFMFLCNKEIITKPCPAPKERKWSVGVQVGYGITMTTTPQFTPYIGVGLSYKLFNF